MPRKLLRTAFLLLIVALALFFPLRVSASSISGPVKFAGALPSLAPIRVSKDHDYCGATLSNESYLIGPKRGLKNVVVYIEGFADQPVPPGEARTRVLANRSCLYSPRIIVMRWGDRLVLKNNDPKLHIIHAYAARRTVFNVALPFPGNSLETTRKIKGPGLLEVNCDTHAWMRAYVHVFGHPFFALTDDRGFFSIGGVPAGRYALKAWHEKAGVQSVDVVAPEDGETEVRLEFGEPGAP